MNTLESEFESPTETTTWLVSGLKFWNGDQVKRKPLAGIHNQRAVRENGVFQDFRRGRIEISRDGARLRDNATVSFFDRESVNVIGVCGIQSRLVSIVRLEDEIGGIGSLHGDLLAVRELNAGTQSRAAGASPLPKTRRGCELSTGSSVLVL